MQTTDERTFPTWALEDTEWASALWILTYKHFAYDERIWSHVNFDEHRMDIRSMLGEGGWSEGETAMLDAAASLYHQTPGCDLLDLWRGLDAEALRRVMDGVMVRLNWLHPYAVPGDPRETLAVDR